MNKQDKINVIYKEIWTDNIKLCSDAWSRDTEPALMIGDVLDYARINNLEEKQFKEITDRKGENTHFTYTPVESMIIALWENPRLPIESQSEEAITYIFNLIEEGQKQ